MRDKTPIEKDTKRIVLLERYQVKEKLRGKVSKLPKESKVKTNIPSTLYTFHDGTKHTKKGLSSINTKDRKQMPIERIIN